jgi:Flp pilus assembly protein TadG
MRILFAAMEKRFSGRRGGAPRRFRRSESGQALVEVAILTPAFLLVLVGAVDFGSYAYDGILVGNAAQAGVQYGAQNNDTSVDVTRISSAVTTEAQGLTLSTPTVSTVCLCAGNGTTTTAANCFVTAPCAGATHRIAYVQVTASGAFQPLMPLPPGLPSPLTITRTAQMQVSP